MLAFPPSTPAKRGTKRTRAERHRVTRNVDSPLSSSPSSSESAAKKRMAKRRKQTKKQKLRALFNCRDTVLTNFIRSLPTDTVLALLDHLPKAKDDDPTFVLSAHDPAAEAFPHGGARGTGGPNNNQGTRVDLTTFLVGHAAHGVAEDIGGLHTVFHFSRALHFNNRIVTWPRWAYRLPTGNGHGAILPVAAAMGIAPVAGGPAVPPAPGVGGPMPDIGRAILIIKTGVACEYLTIDKFQLQQ